MESKEEKIGFHKGSLATLAKEQEALLQMLSVVQQLMQVHYKALKELGVDLEAEIRKAQEEAKKQKSTELAERLK